jgi:hypothetical protein
VLREFGVVSQLQTGQPSRATVSINDVHRQRRKLEEQPAIGRPELDVVSRRAGKRCRHQADSDDADVISGLPRSRWLSGKQEIMYTTIKQKNGNNRIIYELTILVAGLAELIEMGLNITDERRVDEARHVNLLLDSR